MSETTNFIVLGEDKASRIIRVRPNLIKLMAERLAVLNKDHVGRRIKASDLVEYALKVLGPEHDPVIREARMNFNDRMKKLRELCEKKYGDLTFPKFISLLRAGKLEAIS